MPTAVQFRRGTTSQHSSFTGAAGEITVDTDKDVAVVHDGSTAGGFPLAAIAKAQTFTAAQRGTVSALTDGATITPNFATANNFSVTLGGNRTLANPTNLTAGQSGAIAITQDGTGSRTLAFGSYWKFPSGTAPTLTTTASKTDLLVYYVESSTRISAQVLLNMGG
jgi:hypothetical protein